MNALLATRNIGSNGGITHRPVAGRPLRQWPSGTDPLSTRHSFLRSRKENVRTCVKASRQNVNDANVMSSSSGVI
ncbi:hypothetical protein OUZ56_008277 [Daphnia magna]|uniref:Uncharacterized protein n=1 Tax=Daphnia magna TaxID=35525 RepID=A0ABR0ACH0_9CRUS|nr:hypothetical protein OUZ56_008277 [Daphnia magna]